MKEDEKPMLVKLARDYLWTVENRVGGHMIGFYKKEDDVKEFYEFPTGRYTIKDFNGNFFLRSYDVTNDFYVKYNKLK